MIGVYKITNKINGKMYIGSSVNVFDRWKYGHLKDLRLNKHNNRHLQGAWNKYGENNFEFSVIEECTKDVVRERELYWINKNQSVKFGYNILSNTNTGLGVSASKEVRHKISQKCKGKLNGNYGRKHTQEEIELIRKNRWGENYVKKKRKPYQRKTYEELQISKRRLSELAKIRNKSPEHRLAISMAMKGKKWSQERKDRLPSRKGPNNAHSKLSKQQVLEIYEKMNNGVNYKIVCNEYNIGQCLAYKIKRKEHWVFDKE